MHGAGVIEAIENKEIQGVIQQYYIIKLSINNLQIMVPVGNEAKLGIRPVSDNLTFQNVLTIFENGESDPLLTCKERLKINTEKIRTGNLQESVEVVRDLMRMNKDKALNSSEKKVLNKAKELLLSELVLINGITDSEIKSFS